MRYRRLISALDTRRAFPTSQLPPSFLTPRLSHHLSTESHSSQFRNTGPEIPPFPSRPEPLPSREPSFPNAATAISLKTKKHHQPSTQSTPSAKPPLSLSQIKSRPIPALPTSPSPALNDKPLILSHSILEHLPHLRAQQPLYIRAHFHRFPFLLTTGDTVRLPFHLHGVSPGDVLRLNRATVLGSRDFTLKPGFDNIPPDASLENSRTRKATRYIDERLFECRARVIGVDSGPMLMKEKTKRRQRRVKTVKSKHKYTVLRVMEIKVKAVEELGDYVIEPLNMVGGPTPAGEIVGAEAQR